MTCYNVRNVVSQITRNWPFITILVWLKELVGAPTKPTSLQWRTIFTRSNSSSYRLLSVRFGLVIRTKAGRLEEHQNTTSYKILSIDSYVSKISKRYPSAYGNTRRRRFANQSTNRHNPGRRTSPTDHCRTSFSFEVHCRMLRYTGSSRATGSNRRLQLHRYTTEHRETIGLQRLHR